MEVAQLHGMVLTLVMIGMVLGVGILIIDKFGTATRDTVSVTDESIAISGSTGNTANSPLKSVSRFGNSTNYVTTFNCPTCTVNWTEDGVITVNNVTFPDGTYNISYTYYSDSQATTTMSQVVSAISPIGGTWLPLIVTVAALSIVLGLVIKSFSGAAGRR